MAKNSGKRKLFIGSSKEGLKIASKLFDQFYHDDLISPVIWTDAKFRLGQTTLASLLEMLPHYYYAVMVVTPDDSLEKRSEKKKSIRDNVLFELGLFLGAHGRRRTFVVKPDSPNLHWPTDLVGFTAATYRDTADPHELTTSIHKTANDLKAEIEQHEQDRRAIYVEKIERRRAELHLGLAKAPNDRARVRLVLDNFKDLVKEKSSAMDQSVQEVVEDFLLLATTLSDFLDPEQLAKVQGDNLKSVVVYAPEPLEALPQYTELRKTVYDNLCRGVPYVYCVDSNKSVAVIRNMISEISQELAELDGEKSLDELLELVNVVVLGEGDFLTYFTVHYYKADEPDVFQSFVRPMRADILMRLQKPYSLQILGLIESKLSNAVSISLSPA